MSDSSQTSSVFGPTSGHAVRKLGATAPDAMQKDVAARRAPDFDALGGAILRAAERHGIPAPSTRELVELVAERAER